MKQAIIAHAQAIIDLMQDDAEPANDLTPRIVMEILEHEAIVFEAYKDSVGVWTWGVGITDASGHRVDRYRDKPQTLERVLEVYIWALRNRYLPAVLEAFKGFDLAEHELGAALSFHYNTGAIGRADWVRHCLKGDREEAYAAFMNWSRPPEIIPRRKAERDLFFNGNWRSDGRIVTYQVGKPSYTPLWSSAREIDVSEAVRAAL